MSVGHWYSGCRGRSLGRILHFIESYCGFNIMESCEVGGSQPGIGEVHYWGELLATFTWNHGDIPTFVFYGKQAKYFTEQQEQHKQEIIDYDTKLIGKIERKLWAHYTDDEGNKHGLPVIEWEVRPVLKYKEGQLGESVLSGHEKEEDISNFQEFFNKKYGDLGYEIEWTEHTLSNE